MTQKLTRNEIQTDKFASKEINANRLIHIYKKVTIVFNFILLK